MTRYIDYDDGSYEPSEDNIDDEEFEYILWLTAEIHFYTTHERLYV